MNEQTSKTLALWASLIALVASIASGGTVYGSLIGRIDRAEQDITRMQTDNRTAQATLNQISIRVERIDTKLEVLLPSSTIRELERD